MVFRDALDLHVELVAYCNRANDGTLPAHVLILPAITEYTSKLWEEFAVVLYGTWDDAVARCYEAHDADTDSGASNRDVSIMKRRKGRWVGVGGNRGCGCGAAWIRHSTSA